MRRERNYDQMPCAHIVRWVEQKVNGQTFGVPYPVYCGVEFQEHPNTPEADHQFVEDDDNE